MRPQISVIVPCYNQAEYLDEALESVIGQSYTNWECIIVDDGSPDNTKQIAKKWCAKDNRFIYLLKENGGLSSARNAGIQIASASFILPLDADDKINKDYIALALAEFEKNEHLKIVYCKAEKFGLQQGLWQLEDFSLAKLAQLNMIFCSAVFKKHDWSLVDGYDVNMIYGIEDWEFWIAILKNGGDVKRINYIGFNYRVKKSSMKTELNEQRFQLMCEYMSIKHADFFISQLGSFRHLIYKNLEVHEQLKSEKFIINLFFKMFFKFKPFKNIKD